MADQARPTWLILSTANDVFAPMPEGYSVSYGLCHPPKISVPGVQQVPHKAEGYPDPTIDAIASTLWLIRCPPDVRANPRHMRPSYVVHNFASRRRSTMFINKYPDGFFDNVNKVGVVAAPNNPRYFIVADLSVVAADATVDPDAKVVRFVYYKSLNSAWETKVDEDLPTDQNWHWDDVVSEHGTMYWIDNSKGLVCWDTFGVGREAFYVPLPDHEAAGEEHAAGGGPGDTYVRRYVQLSAGLFRYIKIRKPNNPKKELYGAPAGSSAVANVLQHAGHCASASLVVTVRTLIDPFEGQGVWGDVNYQFEFADIWASEKYKAAKLPEKDPVFALIDLENPDVLYFYIDKYIVAVDGPAKTMNKFL